jgi:glutamate synthase (ferredoxin)
MRLVLSGLRAPAALVFLSATVVSAFVPAGNQALSSHRSSSFTAVESQQQQQQNSAFAQTSSWSTDYCNSRLSMSTTTKQSDSTMFDGPMALTKERDACGVGFIANTQSGGKSKSPIPSFHPVRHV